jgi:branched-chain amino acid transport system substrate-binding protein
MKSFWYSALFLLTLLSASTASAAPVKLTVGFIAALSGSAQSYGEAARNGFEMALREVRDVDVGDGAIHVIYEDDQFTPAKTVSSFNKLANLDSIDVAVCVGSATCNAIAPLAQSRAIPLFGWASDRNVSLGRSMVMRTYPSGENEGKRAVEEALSKNFSKIGMITTIHDYPQSWRAGALETLKPENLAFETQVMPDLKDFRSLLLKARSRGAQDLLLCTLPGQAGLIAKQALELGIKPKIGGCEFLSDKNELALSGGALKGGWFITVQVAQAFRANYLAQYKNDNAISGAVVHYDLGKLLLKVAGKVTRQELISALLNLRQHESAAGTVLLKNIEEDRYFEYPLVAQMIG